MPKQEATPDPKIPINTYMVGRTRREYETSESIFSQGDPADAVYYLQSGKVKLTVVSMSGKEAVIAYFTAVAFLAKPLWRESSFVFPPRTHFNPAL